MRILERYITIEILKTFLFALVVFAAVFFIGSTYTLLRANISLRQLAIVLPFAIPYSLPFLIPVSLLVGCALAYGRLAADNEVIPIVTSGVHLRSIVAPALLLGACLSAVVFGLNATVIPYSKFRMRYVQREFIESLLHLGQGTDKRITDGKSFDLFARRVDGARLEGVQLVLRRGKDEDETVLAALGGLGDGPSRALEIVAERAEVCQDPARDALLLIVRDASVTTFGESLRAPAATAEAGDRGALRRAVERLDVGAVTLLLENEYRGRRSRNDFRSNRALLDLATRIEDWSRFARSDAPASLCAPALATVAGALAAPAGGPGSSAAALASISAASPGPERVRDAEKALLKILAVLHERGALAAAPFAFSLVAAAIPLLLRANNRLVPLFVAFLTVTLTFFVPFFTFSSLVEKSGLAPFPALWVPAAATAAAGLGLLARLFRM